MSDLHNPLPVKGYQPQSDYAIRLVNENKQTEEAILRELDEMMRHPELFDPRWVSIGRTHMEQAWMAINRAIFRPDRVILPGDRE